MKNWVALLAENGLPPAPGVPTDARWIMGTDDWWVRTEKGWYWLRGESSSKTWVFAPLGPS
jgi:hypothetical protein